jgi:DNA-binding Xre family transcriptional regulator
MKISAVLLRMRLRIPELLDARGLTPYFLSQKSKGRISLSTAYRLRRDKGRLQMFDADLLEALCELLQVEPGELFERSSARKDPVRKAR